MYTFRLLHKWVGLLLGLQFILWALSGAMMALIDHHEVSGAHNRNMISPPVLGRWDVGFSVADIRAQHAGTEIRGLQLRSVLDRFVYQVTTDQGTRLFDAEDGSEVRIDAETARLIALQDYAGTGAIKAVELITAPTLEVRRHEGPVWRVDFDDGENTTLYIAEPTGLVLERRNDSWRLFDFFWMLHIMDYTGRQDFNHPLIIFAAISTVWLSISGMFLLFDSFKWRELNPALALRRLRGGTVPVHVGGGTAGATTFNLPVGLSYFDAFAKRGVLLPSNCGGGGTCGLCRLKLSPAEQVTDPDARYLSPQEIGEGWRLACRHAVRPGAAVCLPDHALETEGRTARVVSARFLSPFIKEIRLALDSDAFSYRAGQYVQIEIPTYDIAAADLEIPEGYAQDWGALGLPERHRNSSPVRRTYSMAGAPAESGREISLNVRFMPSASPTHAPCGVGSTFMFALKPGDEVKLHGPFGTFAAPPGATELVVIGGGAGMAPLRAIMRDELLHARSGRRISFWYGARNQRDILYRAEFEALAAEHPNLDVHIALSEPQAEGEWSGQIGLIHEVVRDTYLLHHPDLTACDFLVCGPPAMLEATLGMLRALGVPRERIAFDDFGI